VTKERRSLNIFKLAAEFGRHRPATKREVMRKRKKKVAVDDAAASHFSADVAR
jgi:hypothetical protein